MMEKVTTMWNEKKLQYDMYVMYEFIGIQNIYCETSAMFSFIFGRDCYTVCDGHGLHKCTSVPD